MGPLSDHLRSFFLQTVNISYGSTLYSLTVSAPAPAPVGCEEKRRKRKLSKVYTLRYATAMTALTATAAAAAVWPIATKQQFHRW